MSYKNDREMKLVKDIDKTGAKKPEVTDKQAEEAFKTILTWIGEDTSREGLLETPKRVVKAFKEYFRGYHQDAMYGAQRDNTTILYNTILWHILHTCRPLYGAQRDNTTLCYTIHTMRYYTIL